MQIPGADLEARFAAEKGAPLDAAELSILAERRRAAAAWLEAYAPERARVAVQHDALPPEVAACSDEQRLFLGALALEAEAASPGSGDAWQDLIFRVAERAVMPPGRAFGALYLAFLGRTNGPRAGWLLASLPRDFVLARLRAAAGWRAGTPA
jgi:lysyl-tRNA synthetase class I